MKRLASLQEMQFSFIDFSFTRFAKTQIDDETNQSQAKRQSQVLDSVQGMLPKKYTFFLAIDPAFMQLIFSSILINFYLST